MDSNHISKEQFYTAMAQNYTGLTQADFSSLEQVSYEVKLAELEQAATAMGVDPTEAEDYAYSFIFVHLPKGEKPKKTPKVKAAAIQPTPKKIADVSTTVDQTEASRHQEQAIAALQQQLQEQEQNLAAVMNSKAEWQHKAEALQSKLAEVCGELEIVSEELARVKVEATAKDEKSKLKPSQPATPKPAQPNKTKLRRVNPIPRARHTGCSPEEAAIGDRIGQLIKFFLDEAEQWNKSQSSRNITKILSTKEDQPAIILEVADYAGLSGLTTFLGNRKYYRLCVDSFKLDKVDAPTRGSYAVVVKEARMKQVYTTRGEQQYTICLKSYRELLKCSFEGTCTTAQSDRWKNCTKNVGIWYRS